MRSGDDQAAGKLWHAFFLRMLNVAKQRLGAKGAFDEEDVALSAFFVFCQSVEQGQFQGIQDRDALWRCLAHVTAHKACDYARYESAQKRGGGDVKLAADVGSDIHPFATSDSDPAFAAAMADECRRLLEKLNDPQLEQAAIGKLEGLTNDEIAEIL